METIQKVNAMQLLFFIFVTKLQHHKEECCLQTACGHFLLKTPVP